MDVPVCYCFDWTRERLLYEGGLDQQPTEQIKAHARQVAVNVRWTAHKGGAT